MTRRQHAELIGDREMNRIYTEGHINRRRKERIISGTPWSDDRRTLWKRLSDAWKSTPLWERRFIIGNLVFWGVALAIAWWF